VPWFQFSRCKCHSAILRTTPRTNQEQNTTWDVQQATEFASLALAILEVEADADQKEKGTEARLR
jgi:hypothetical protein